MPVEDYRSLRSFGGRANGVRVTGVYGTAAADGIAGTFKFDPSDSTTPDNGATVIVDRLGRRFKRQFDGIMMAEWWGARGDGVTDDTDAVQASIDYVFSQGGGAIGFKAKVYRLNIVLKRGVCLVGATFGATRGVYSFGPETNLRQTMFLSAGRGWVVDTPTAGYTTGAGILGIGFKGLGAQVAGGGLRMRVNSDSWIVRACSFEWFADEALHTNGLIGSFENLVGTNCLLNRARTNRTGVFRFEGADNFIQNIQGNTGITGLNVDASFVGAISGKTLKVVSVASGSLQVGQYITTPLAKAQTRITGFGTGSGGVGTYTVNTPQDLVLQPLATSNFFLCGIMIGGANNYALNLEGELSEIGIYTVARGAIHKIANSRADLNYGFGFWGTGVQLSNCHALNNGRLSSGFSGLWSGFCPAGVGPFQYTGCRADGPHSFGFDLRSTDTTKADLRGLMSGCASSGHAVAHTRCPEFESPIVSQMAGIGRGADKILDVFGLSGWRNTSDSRTEIIGLKGAPGQYLTIVGNSNTILVRGPGFDVKGAALDGKKQTRDGYVYTFFNAGYANDAQNWVEMLAPPALWTSETRPGAEVGAGFTGFNTTTNQPEWRNSGNTGWLTVATVAV